ncbi:LpxI family protein [Propylenella binzhouense]|uniref:DUF1009 domain-containing protein n=1 Tax=Propylenella binzhouense TaxID=2555902 RepID=A0A964T3D5_9HYPH|nr:UDP-2,3-diacylglucosamine diphosphatase LpxI [Propylenella binzhouense]MYZ47723.1 DUF1009 domain-containing protein [Propylenella binzhouense]
MTGPASAEAIAILAGAGTLPSVVAAAAEAAGHRPVPIAIEGEADLASLARWPAHRLRWGEIGRLFRILASEGCGRAVFVGGISRRPDLGQLAPDLGALRLLPRVFSLMRGGDDRLLAGVAAIFEERNVRIVSPLEVAPGLALGTGVPTRRAPSSDDLRDVALATAAARAIGALDIGQAAVAVQGRVVGLEAAEGTDALLARIADLRRERRIAASGGVLVKCMKPRQDPRLDLPTIGPTTAENVARAGLSGVAGEAGRALVAGRAETIRALDARGLFLLGVEA